MNVYPYLYANPNALLVPRAERHPARTVLRRIFLVLLSVLLCCSLLAAVLILSVRQGITSEFIYRYAEGLEYADFPISLDGQVITISEAVQESFAAVGLPLTAEDVDTLFDQFSIPVIMASLAQDFADWFLMGGSRPVLDPYEIASMALMGLDRSILNILQFLGTPVDMFASVLAAPLDSLDLEGLCDSLEPFRQLLSADTLAILLSVCGVLAVLVFMLCGCSLSRAVLPFGCVSLFCGLGASAAAICLPVLIRRASVIFRDYILRLFSPVCRNLWTAALWLCIIGVICTAFCLIRYILRQRRLPPRKLLYDGEEWPDDEEENE